MTCFLEKSKRKLLSTLFAMYFFKTLSADGSIDIDELCEFLGKEEDVFMENFFELMDVDEDGVWGFGEFLHALAKFLCGTQEMLIERKYS